jgi:hypothetical protein
MAAIKLPGIPDVTGRAISDDPQLRELLLAIKITLELITGATGTEFDELLEKNE